MPDNLYDRLGVAKDADRATIRKAFKKLASKHHPDKNDDSVESKEMFQAIREAYDTLSDDERRKLYDETGEIKSGVSNEKQQCLNTLYQVFSQMIQQHNYWEYNYPEMLREFVNSGVEQMKNARNKCQYQQESMGKLKKRFSGTLFDMQKHAVEANLEEAERKYQGALKESVLMLELIEDLKYYPAEDVGLMTKEGTPRFSTRFVGFDGSFR